MTSVGFIYVPPEPELREYTEITLHMKGGAKVVGNVEDFKTKTNLYGEYTEMKWAHTKWDDLPQLESVRLAELQAVTSRKISEVK